MIGYRGCAVFLALVAPAAGGCFEAPRPAIGFQCGPEGQCPSGYECRQTGCCHRIGSPDDGECSLLADAAVSDGPTSDSGASDAGAADGSASMLASFLPSPLVLTDGTTAELTVTIGAAAPSGGVEVSLSSDDTGVASVPATVTVAAGNTSAIVAITGEAPGSATIEASLDGDMEAAQVTVASPTASAGDLVISEFLALASGEDEFVEIYNPGPLTYDLTGWFIDMDGGDDPIAPAALDGSRVYVGPGARVWGVPNGADATGADFVWDDTAAGIPLADGGGALSLELPDGSTAIDVVDYTAWEVSSTATPAASQFAGLSDRSTQLAAAAHTAAGNDNGASWCVPAASTPGAANAPCTAVVINEVLPDPVAGPDADEEFVELFAVAGADLSGLVLRVADADGVLGSGLSVTLPAGTRAPLDRYFVYADAAGGTSGVADADLEGDNGLLPDDGGLQLLRDSSLVDALGYGTLNDTTDDTDGLASVEGSAAASPGQGASLARDSASSDSDDNATDFGVAATPTPGAGNN